MPSNTCVVDTAQAMPQAIAPSQGSPGGDAVVLSNMMAWTSSGSGVVTPVGAPRARFRDGAALLQAPSASSTPPTVFATPAWVPFIEKGMLQIGLPSQFQRSGLLGVPPVVV